MRSLCAPSCRLSSPPIRSGNEPAVTGEEGVASLEIAIRCLESRALPPLGRAGGRAGAG